MICSMEIARCGLYVGRSNTAQSRYRRRGFRWVRRAGAWGHLGENMVVLCRSDKMQSMKRVSRTWGPAFHMGRGKYMQFCYL